MITAAEWVQMEEPAVDLEAEVLRLYPTNTFKAIAAELGTSDQIVSNVAHRLQKRGLLKLRTVQETRLMMLGRNLPRPSSKRPLSMSKVAIRTRAYRARVRARGDHQ